MNRTDILIVGAGFAGLPIALACAKAGWQVTLVDPKTTIDAASADPLDQQCTAISSASEGLLTRWGVWDAIQANAQPIRQVHISQKGYLGSVHLDADDLAVSTLGHVIENRHWIAALSAKVQASPSIQWLRGESVIRISEVNDDALEVEFTSGKALHTHLLLATDGINSQVRTLMGGTDTQKDFEQHALMSTLRFSKPHEDIAYERFTASGPLALLPRPDNHMSLVWCLPTTDATFWADANEEAVIGRLQELVGYKLGRIQAIGPKVLLPLARREAVQQAFNRTLLLGNAARLLHPVAGQGFNLVLRDVACLLDLIGLQNDGVAPDPGRPFVLEEFVALRRQDQQRVVTLTDSLAKGFLGEASLPAHIRGLGLLGLDAVGPLRRLFARNTMGYTG